MLWTRARLCNREVETIVWWQVEGQNLLFTMLSDQYNGRFERPSQDAGNMVVLAAPSDSTRPLRNVSPGRSHPSQ